MIDQYEKEINELKTKMQKAEDFANKLPLFREKIIRDKMSGESGCKFGDSYKQIPLNWGINRWDYSGSRSKNITNYHGECDCFLFSIYINTLTIYDMYENFGLKESIPESSYFFFDAMNTTFYAKDDTIEELLESLNDWYLVAIEKARDSREAGKKEKLLKELGDIEKRELTRKEAGQ
jgi:hypothetical protein